MALLIAAKAGTVIITALLGFAGGHMIYLQLNENTPLALAPLTPALIALAGYLVLSSVLSVHAIRRLGNLRLVIGLGMIVLGPLLIIWL